MKHKKFAPDYATVLRYLLFFISVIVMNNLQKRVMPYSFALLVSASFNGLNAVICSLLYLISFLCQGAVGLLLSGAISCAIIIIVNALYKKFSVSVKYEIVLLGAVGMLVFALIGDTSEKLGTETVILCAVITTLLTFVCHVFINAVLKKGLKYKLGYDEFFSVAIITVLFGLGVSNAFSPYIWKGVSVLLILLCAFVYKKGFAVIVSATLGISLSVYYSNVNYASAFLILGLVAESLTPYSRHVAGITVLICDYLTESFFGIYGGYLLGDFLSTLCGVTVFFFIPTKLLRSLKDKLYTFREKQLTRVAINRNRLLLSNRLYQLSGVFGEMSDAFINFKKCTLDTDKAKSLIHKEILNTACKDCPNRSKCKAVYSSDFNGLHKLIDLGFAKGKLSLIDLPKELSEICIHPNNILYGLNKLLADYRNRLIENQNIENGRTLIANEVQGVSDILRGLALESGATLKYQSRLERSLTDKLFKDGFCVSELLIYGEENRVTVGVILTMNEFDQDKLCRIISKTVGADMRLSDRTTISADKCYLSFNRACDYDAVYGISQARKDGSPVSGDTHSVTRLSDDRFLVALSDGMGSGENANRLSSVSLSLIESFYKAGMNSNLILDTVNKLMSVTAEDDFTALDVSVIDLKNCTADFIKYGAPYGFIVSQNGIRIVESNTLPLGILDELKPSVCTAELNDGDIILLVTDGVSDAFGCANDLIDYLRRLPAKNPQTLCDNVMKKALEYADGKKADDMTALAVRVVKRKKPHTA